MALAATVDVALKMLDAEVILFNIVASGNYVNPGGDTLELGVFSRLARQPKQVYVYGIAGYVYSYILATKKLLVLFGDNNNAADGPLIEIPNGAYPAGVTGDTIKAMAIYG